MGDVAFHTATTVDEALALLGDGSDARVVAGGSDLIVQARHGKSLPGTVIAIHRIDALRTLNSTGDLVVGALTSHATLCADAGVRSSLRRHTQRRQAQGPSRPSRCACAARDVLR